MEKSKGPLSGLRVLDMSRILAGPSATQILGDLGADIIKIEKPQTGDDTRKWGPPYVTRPDGSPSSESSYYLSCNRNKRSVTLDYTKPEGVQLLKKLLGKCDILIENYKAGTLDKYGLGYEQLKDWFPKLIYCSLTGFGHTGPYRDRAGYDFLIQAMGGIMSLTGPAEGEPYKTGVAVADLMTGMYAITGILSALHHRHVSGKGQFIDVALLDSQIAWLSNAGQYYLTSGVSTPRMGNAHPTIVPYEVFEASDGYFVLAVGNDRQFEDFCAFAQRPELAADHRFSENKNRVINRAILVPIVRDILKAQTRAYWIGGLEKSGVPCGPVNNLEQAFKDPQVQARNMTVDMHHPHAKGPVKLIANPLRLSKTPVSYDRAPPTLGQHTQEVLKELLALPESEFEQLRAQGIV